MPQRNTNDPNHWLERAAQMRALALTMKDAEVIILMTDLAADYEKHAERAAAKTAGKLNAITGAGAGAAASHHGAAVPN